MCAPEFSDIETAIWQKYKDRGVVVIGASSENTNKIQQFVQEQGITFPILKDSGGGLYSSYRLAGAISPYPRDYIIDQNGVFAYTNVEYSINEMSLVVESLLEEPTTVDDGQKSVIQPEKFKLGQNYPNPFNPVTRFEYIVAEPAFVDIAVYNVVGRKIIQLVKQFKSPGSYYQEWNGLDDNGESVTSGVYFYKMMVGGEQQKNKMMLLR